MRMSRIAAAAGLFVAALGIGSAAEARPHDDARWHDGRSDHRWERSQGHHRGYSRGYGHRYGRAYAYRHHPRCWTEWRHHHRVRVCR